MNTSTEILAFAIRLLADKTDLIRKPTDFETILAAFSGKETFDITMAREVERNAKRGAELVKRARTNRKFKKITADL